MLMSDRVQANDFTTVSEGTVFAVKENLHRFSEFGRSDLFVLETESNVFNSLLESSNNQHLKFEVKLSPLK